MNSTTFGELIKQARIEKGLALREVAAAIALDQSQLSKVERDKMVAPQRVISKLATCLDVEYKELQIKYLSDKLYQELIDVDFSMESLKLAGKRLATEKSTISSDAAKKKLIKRIASYLKNKPIERVWVFGSFARNEEGVDSDIDLLIRFSKPNKMDLFEYIGIRQDLEDLTGRPIDLVEEGQELEKIKPFINKDKQLIYERKAS